MLLLTELVVITCKLVYGKLVAVFVSGVQYGTGVGIAYVELVVLLVPFARIRPGMAHTFTTRTGRQLQCSKLFPIPQTRLTDDSKPEIRVSVIDG